MRRYLTIKGSTLIEIITVLAVLGVLGGIIYTVFITNWMATEDRISRAGMLYETEVIFDSLSKEGRNAHQIDVSQDPGALTQTATFRSDLTSPSSDVIYTMTNQGKLFIQNPRNSNPIVMTEHLDFARSSFEKEGKTLKFKLGLKDQIFMRSIDVTAASEVYPRN